MLKCTVQGDADLGNLQLRGSPAAPVVQLRGLLASSEQLPAASSTAATASAAPNMASGAAVDDATGTEGAEDGGAVRSGISRDHPLAQMGEEERIMYLENQVGRENLTVMYPLPMLQRVSPADCRFCLMASAISGASQGRLI